ncbi:hypothetical protein MKW98_027410 [Papaver atlanticum]|uniref:Uncharacterized protein n=1 Tax=Papaver atlanticum TaxID=357466 RepID=A0AAD4TIP3_9MAGN|nr:hypothetical protein MKW98_027410 [Papaver atlanticum]
MLDTKHIHSVDQEELETVIPQIGGLVKIVNGAYLGIGSSARQLIMKTSARLHNESLMMLIKGQTVESNSILYSKRLILITRINKGSMAMQMVGSTWVAYVLLLRWLCGVL